MMTYVISVTNTNDRSKNVIIGPCKCCQIGVLINVQIGKSEGIFQYYVNNMNSNI